MVESVCFEANGYIVKFYRDSGPSGEGYRVYPVVLEFTNRVAEMHRSLQLVAEISASLRLEFTTVTAITIGQTRQPSPEGPESR